jgi:hypothetical protein
MTQFVRLAVNNDWLLEEGWALYLQGSHFVRSGVEGLGSELQRRGISRQSQWGAHGIVYVIPHSLVVATPTMLLTKQQLSDIRRGRANEISSKAPHLHL